MEGMFSMHNLLTDFPSCVSDDGGEAQRHRTGERHAQGQPQRRGIGKSASLNMYM